MLEFESIMIIEFCDQIYELTGRSDSQLSFYSHDVGGPANSPLLKYMLDMSPFHLSML